MHYYKRNLGDYAKKAGRLSMLQHGAYTLLLDACYDRERFPTELEAIEWTWASTPEEEQAVRFVLSRFFEQDEATETYVQPRVRDELNAYKVGDIQNRLIALAREAKKRKQDSHVKAYDQLRSEIKNAPLSKTHEAWTNVVDALVKTHETAPNQEPLTTNQELRTKEEKKNTLSAAPTVCDRFPEFWAAYPRGTNRKKAHEVWKRKRLDAKADEIVRNVTERARGDPQWLRGVIPHASTYLNNERWEDEDKTPAAADSPGTVKPGEF